MKVGAERAEDHGGSQGCPVETCRQRHPVDVVGCGVPRGVRRCLYRWWLKLGQKSE